MSVSKLALLAAAALSFAAPSMAANISFLGNLAGPNDVLLFNFNVGADSTVTLRSYSYAGGVNAEGTVVARGGFDPILTLYNNSGDRIAFQDDGPEGSVPTDINGAAYDVNFQQLLATGNYTVALTAFSNFCGATIAEGCPGGGSFSSAGGARDAHFAFDILNVEDAAQTGGGDVPEPAMLGLFGLGAIGLGLTRRRRRA